MIVPVEAGGRIRTVEVRRDRDRFIVAIDGRERTVDVHEIGTTWSLLIGRTGDDVTAVPDAYDITIAAGGDGTMMVHVDGHPVEVSIVPSRVRWTGARGGGLAESGGPQRISTPMPGKIVKLLVKAGDQVAAGQGVVVVEAMKMENELRARAAAIVSEVRVQEGALVEAGAILVILG